MGRNGKGNGTHYESVDRSMFRKAAKENIGKQLRTFSAIFQSSTASKRSRSRSAV